MKPTEQLATQTELTWTPELVTQFWQHYATNRQVDYFTDLFGAQVIEKTKGYYQPTAIVCDYGCGAGFLLEHILKSHRASGCDFTPENIEATRVRLGKHPNLLELFSVADAVHVNGTFDVIYIVETIEHVLEDDLDNFFQTVYRLLKPNGVVIATTPNQEDLQANDVYCPSCKHSFHRWQHIRSFDSIGIQTFMSRGGFIATKVFATDFAAVKWWPRFKATARPILGKKNPHLVYIGHKPIA